MSQKFDWRAHESAINRRNHGVTFERGVRATLDPFALERIDERENYGEERVTLVGLCDGVILHVTYEERGETIRIISGRRAERHEEDHYFRENAG